MTSIQFDLGIIVPSIRPHSIRRLYDSVAAATNGLRVKFIVVGNYTPDFECTHLMSLASPNMCVHQGIVELADDCEYIKWSTDDAVYFPNALNELISDMRGHNSFGVVKYTEEGPPNNITGKDDVYYTAVTHDDLRRLPGVKPSYRIAPVSVYKREDFMSLGGLDCRYEHINLSTHDLAFRAQEFGISPVISRNVEMHCDSNSSDVEHRPLDIAHFHNDYPIFANKYVRSLKEEDIIIDIFNYTLYPLVWRRFV